MRAKANTVHFVACQVPRWDRPSGFVACHAPDLSPNPEDDRPRKAMVCPTHRKVNSIGAKALLTVLAGIVLAGCSLRGKPAKLAVAPAAPKPVVAPAPAAPPTALSIPQTHVELPKPQPAGPAALDR